MLAEYLVVSATHLIGFEAALAELSSLYIVAKDFRPLRARAEREFLVSISALGARLRRCVRLGSLDEEAVDAAAKEIARLRQEWREVLAQLRASRLYQSCLAAWLERNDTQLVQFVPELFSDCVHSSSPLTLYAPFSPSSGRRRPGQSPFLSPPACAERIEQLQQAGIAAEPTGKEWWDMELVPITLASDPESFDSPLALRFDATHIGVPVFHMDGGENFRVYVRHLVAPFAVVVQEQVEDEWWQAFAGSYESWRESLATELRRRQIPVDVQSQEGARNG